ncbi:MAG: SDR family oxidoreductase [Chloroflexi bacterium]|nr:SDR family oxidoreductase [Chloroflexota bacterium]
MTNPFSQAYHFDGQCVIITGGAGVLGSQMAGALLACGAHVAILDLNLESAQQAAGRLNAASSAGRALAVQANVLQEASIRAAMEAVLHEFGRVDGLINAAGGNKPAATTSDERSFFDLQPDALRWVFDLNLMGTILPSQVIGRHMAAQQHGVILNISSMNAFRPLTRIPAYSAAKAGVSNFTQWLAVHIAQEYSPHIRVNALAPGFFLTEQNRFLLTQGSDGSLSERGQKILEHTPMGRFGDPQDLLGPMLWLLSPASAFVTGVVIPVDGGFSAYSGV